MSPKFGKIIQKHPWLVVMIVLAITLGFSLFIPSLEFKTDFEDFTPDDPLVQANTRIQEYFGENQQLVFLLLEKTNTESIITEKSLRDIWSLSNDLGELPEVEGSFSLVTFLNIICLIEFGTPLDECTDEQISIALDDLLTTQEEGPMRLFAIDDPNEEIDYNRFPLLSQGSSVDSADLKNCYMENNNDSLIVTFEVYDLKDVGNTVRPVFPKTNIMEWYLSFNNLISPLEILNMTYTLSVHLEPTNPVWEIGKGVLRNIKDLVSNLKNRSLLHQYTKGVYLWIQPPDQDIAFPIPLESGKIEFDTANNQIQLSVSLKELGNYGIASQFGSFGLPAKLSRFTAGTRYYQTPFLKLGGGYISANTSYLFDKLLTIQSRPMLGSISERVLQRYGNLTWNEFNDFFEMMEKMDLLPETIALKDIQDNYKHADRIPDDTSVSDIIFTIVPSFYEDLQLSAFSFISTDYEPNRKPSASIMFLQLTPTKDYDQIINMNTRVVENITTLDEKYNDISIQATGNGIISVQINDITSKANQFIAPSIFIIIMLVLFLNFRRTSYVFLPMLALVISTIWLFGSMVILGISFNVIAVALVPLIMGLGVDYSVHLFHNYRVELEDGRTPAEAIINTVSEIGTAMVLAMITTVIAFLSFLTASIGPVRDFGILLALGVIYTFITSLTILPALRYLLDKRKTVVLNRKTHGLAVRKIMRILSEKILRHEKIILSFMILITLVFATGALKLQTGFNMEQFAPDDTPAIVLFDVIAEKFPFSSQAQEYILIQGNVATVKALIGIKKTQDHLEDYVFVAKNTDESQKITSIYTIIQQSIKNDPTLIDLFNIDTVTRIPKTDRDVKDLYDYLYGLGAMNFSMDQVSLIQDDFNIDESLIPDISTEMFHGEIETVLYKENDTYTATVIRVYIDPLFPSQDGDAHKDQSLLKRQLNEAIYTYGDASAVATGQNIISLTITDSLTESQILSTIAAIALSALILIIIYKNPVLGIIACIPVIISIVWILGTMYFIGYTLNVLTITVTSMTIGIGIDYAIHATERFRFIVDKTGDPAKAVCETISHTGGALLIAALTTSLGFIILLFAPIPPQQQFGLILGITIAYSFLTSILLLPLVLNHWAQRVKRKRGYIISKNGLKFENGKYIRKSTENDRFSSSDCFASKEKRQR
ncbi:MAG: efflux RND transporter permease subunit [Candidatus Thermoplasmatota archaeon]|nr:efflux RND transporter permease subunit [Candidatus Thermoplasmatota archaeon]